MKFQIFQNMVPLSFFLLIVLGIFTYSINITNIHGDAKFHTYFGKISAQSGFLVKDQPRRIYNFEGGKRVYMPIAYPLTSESLFTIFYIFGGETLLELYSPIMAIQIFLLIYILMLDFGKSRALLISLIATLSISQRLIMTPLIEPYIVILLLGGLYFIKRYFNNNDLKSLIISGLFLGASASVKQQGLILTLAITGYVFITIVYKLWFQLKGRSYLIYSFLVFLLLVIFIPAPAIAEQINRTGTFAYSPGETHIPKSLPLYNLIQPQLVSNYRVDPDAAKAMEATILYNKEKLSVVDTFRAFLLSPFLFYRSADQNSMSLYHLYLFYLFVATILIWFISLIKMKGTKSFWLFLIFILIFETIASNFLDTPINQYHSFGVVITTIILITSLFFIFKKNNLITTILLAFVVVNYFIGFTKFVLPLLGQSGREDSYHLEGYKRIGNYVQNHTSKDAIFLAPETSFRYYADRDTVWLNESIGHIVRDVIYSTDDIRAAKILKDQLKVSYIVVNREQFKRYGVNDYLPPEGLASIVDNSNLFSKVYDAYGDNEMVVYKINFEI